MPKILKRILATVLILGFLVGAVWGGLVLYRNLQRKPVSVYEAQSFAMTEYWGDSTSTQGMVTLEGMQRVEMSETAVIREIFVTQGQQVQKGDALLTFDTTLTSLDLEKAQIDVERQKLQLQTMEKELERLYNLRPSSGQPTVIEPTYDHAEASSLPELLLPAAADAGSEEKPIVLLWDVDTPVGVKDLVEALSARELLRLPVQPQPSPDPGASPSPEISAEATVTPEPTGSAEPSPTPEIPSEPTPQPPQSGELCVVILIRTGNYGNAYNGATAAQYGFRLTLDPTGAVTDASLALDLPLPEGVPPEAQPIIIPDKGSGMSSAELKKARHDKETEIRDAELALQLAELDLEKKKAETGDGTLRAQMDGIITAVNDPELAKLEHLPLLVLSAGGGYCIEGELSEWDLSTLQLGQEVTVRSWMTGQELTGTVDAVSDIPVNNSGRYYGVGGANTSVYPFRVFVDASANLQEGEWVDLQYQATAVPEDVFYLEKLFVRTENGSSYCMVKGEDGRLTRRELKTGIELWGSYVQIRSGLELTDRVAFPYGSDVVEGAQTVDKEPQDFYSSMNY